MFTKQGMPGGFFDLVAILEFLGRIFLIIGLLTQIASSLLALEMVGTTLLHVTSFASLPSTLNLQADMNWISCFSQSR
ncbi:MAG: DoxX family membrane protein [Nitrososphaerales archaeon]